MRAGDVVDCEIPPVREAVGRVSNPPSAQPDGSRGRWIALAAAAIQALNVWAVVVSRLGFRAVVQPPLQALTLLFVFRGLRDRTADGAPRRVWIDWALAGLFCGLSAYTYLAIRAFPLLLGAFLLWVLAAPLFGRGGRGTRGVRRRAGQVGLFVLVAAIVFAPLGLFYLRNPQFFGTRMAQVSVFSEEGGWGAFWEAARVSFALFTARGDMNWRFNAAGEPALWLPLGVLFYLGLALGLWRLLRPEDRRLKAALGLLALWLPVMLLPSILGGEAVELSLTLRAIGVMPALYIWPAYGAVEGAAALRVWLGRRERLRRALLWAAAALLLVSTGAYTWIQVFRVWGPSAAHYYVASGDLVDAARYLDAHLPAQANAYIAAEHYRHPTVALTSARYPDLKWLVGDQALVYPPSNGLETWYLFPHEAMPDREWLDRALGAPDEVHPGPDGKEAFVAYRRLPDQAPQPSPQHAGEGNLGGVLRFQGYDLDRDALAAGRVDVILYLHVLSETDRDDWTFFAHLVDEQGFRWGGETFFTYPSAQWAAGETMALRAIFGVWPGAPPGEYALNVGVFSPSLDARLPVLNERGQLAGTALPVGPIVLPRAAAPPEELPPIQQPLDAVLAPGLSLLGYDRDRGDLRPGETLALSLYWRADRPLQDLQVSLALERGETEIPLWEGAPVRGAYPFVRWQPPEFVRDRYALRLPSDAPAGDWTLRLALRRAGGQAAGEQALGAIHVHETDRLWEPPPVDHPVGARLGGVVELVGYDLEPDAARPGETLRLTLVWRCLSEMDRSYTVFTHLLDGGERVRGQQDNPPVEGRYPTTLWAAGEVVVDRYAIQVDADAAAGRYAIEVGMYDPATVQRLPVLDPAGAAGDRVLLGEVAILD